MADTDQSQQDDDPRSAVHVATEGESWQGPDSDRELTPGSPSLEGVAFVLLGALVTLAVLAQFLI